MRQGRKRFAVSANYIGPDRRGKSRGSEDWNWLIDVPNPVQDKLSGHVAHDFVQRSKGTRFITLAEMSLTLRNMTNVLMASPDRIDPEDLYIFSKLGRVIQEKFEREEEEIRREELTNSE